MKHWITTVLTSSISFFLALEVLDIIDLFQNSEKVTLALIVILVGSIGASTKTIDSALEVSRQIKKESRERIENLWQERYAVYIATLKLLSWFRPMTFKEDDINFYKWVNKQSDDPAALEEALEYYTGDFYKEIKKAAFLFPEEFINWLNEIYDITYQNSMTIALNSHSNGDHDASMEAHKNLLEVVNKLNGGSESEIVKRFKPFLKRFE